MEGGLLHYLSLFVVYTLLAVAAIYGVFWFLRKNPGMVLRAGQKSIHSQRKMIVEQIMPLEPRKNLYIVRVDGERFLLATSMDGTQFLSRLENAPETETLDEPTETGEPTGTPRETTVSGRLMQSLQWVINSRTKFSSL